MIEKEYNKCLRCGRKLKTDENRKRGYGKICWEKINTEKKGRLFNVTENNTSTT